MVFKITPISSEHTLSEIEEFLDNLDVRIEVDTKDPIVGEERVELLGLTFIKNIRVKLREPSFYILPQDYEKLKKYIEELEAKNIGYFISIKPRNCSGIIDSTFASGLKRLDRYYFDNQIGLMDPCKEECRAYLDPETSCGRYCRRLLKYVETDSSTFLSTFKKEILQSPRRDLNP